MTWRLRDLGSSHEFYSLRERILLMSYPLHLDLSNHASHMSLACAFLSISARFFAANVSQYYNEIWHAPSLYSIVVKLRLHNFTKFALHASRTSLFWSRISSCTHRPIPPLHHRPAPLTTFLYNLNTGYSPHSTTIFSFNLMLHQTTYSQPALYWPFLNTSNANARLTSEFSLCIVISISVCVWRIIVLYVKHSGWLKIMHKAVENLQHNMLEATKKLIISLELLYMSFGDGNQFGSANMRN